MLPSSLFQLLPGVLSLLLSTGSVLADSSGSITITSIRPSGSCSKGSSACGSNIVGHKTYCKRYMAYCSAKFVGEPSDGILFNKYCRKGGSFDSCRQYETKGTASTTPSARATSTKSQGNHRRYKSSSDFNIRADTTGNLTADNLDVDASDDVWYAVEITLGGANFTVQLDTGSSDLWLHTAGRPVQLTNTTDLVTSETYGQRHVEGKIKFADLQIGELTIERQAFLHVTDSDAHGFDLTSYDGIMGMAFDVGSIHSKVEQEWGAEAANHLALSPMTALFAQNTSLPNNFDVRLSRPAAELDDIASGFIMISTHAPGYENVVNAPRLPRVALEHWSVAMDGMLIDGQSFAFNQSRIEGVPTGRIAAVLDTGSSFPALPPAAVDAIYGSVPGAVYDNITEVWLIPCDRSPNITFVFGGQQFPVHPLDLTSPVTDSLLINDWDTDIATCVNTFQYLTTDPTSSDGFDIILADAFLHNVYASFDYGDWNPTNNTDGTPFVQMISTTDSATMWADFRANRTATLAQLPLPLDPALIVQYEAGSTPTDPASPATTSSSGPPTQSPDTLAKLSGAVSTGETPSADDDSWGNKCGKVVLALLGANLAVGVASLVVTLTTCVRGRKHGTRRSVRARSGSRYAPVQFKEPKPKEEHGAERASMMSSDCQ